MWLSLGGVKYPSLHTQYLEYSVLVVVVVVVAVVHWIFMGLNVEKKEEFKLMFLCYAKLKSKH